MLTVPKLGSQTADRVVEPAPPITNNPDAMLAQILSAADLKKLTLSKPIRSHQGEVRVLELREPVAGDYIEIGKVPFDVRGADEDRRAVVDFKLAGQWAARLTGLDEILIGQLAGRDWLELVGRINALLVRASIDDLGNSGASSQS